MKSRRQRWGGSSSGSPCPLAEGIDKAHVAGTVWSTQFMGPRDASAAESDPSMSSKAADASLQGSVRWAVNWPEPLVVVHAPGSGRRVSQSQPRFVHLSCPCRLCPVSEDLPAADGRPYLWEHSSWCKKLQSYRTSRWRNDFAHIFLPVTGPCGPSGGFPTPTSPAFLPPNAHGYPPSAPIPALHTSQAAELAVPWPSQWVLGSSLSQDQHCDVTLRCRDLSTPHLSSL